METSGIRVQGLTKKFGDVWALRSLDLDVNPGEFVVLLGPSGCGKTTALRMIAGLEEPTDGSVYIGDRLVNGVEPAARDIAMVFQNYALYPHMTVEANLAFGLKMRGASKEERKEKVAWASSMLGLDGLLSRKPSQLSGGQRQRVALGRAMVRKPKVYLFDEPLSNLDARLRIEMRAEIADMHRQVGATMVFVTHDQVEAMTLGNRIAVLKDGLLQQFSTPMEVYSKPNNLFVAQFVGTPTINTVRGVLKRENGDQSFVVSDASWTLPMHKEIGDAVAGIRPESLRFVSPDVAEAKYTARVQRIEALGNEMLVWVDGPDREQWVVRTPPDFPGSIDDVVGVTFEQNAVHLFEASSGRKIDPVGGP